MVQLPLVVFLLPALLCQYEIPRISGGYVDLGTENEEVWMIQKNQADGKTVVKTEDRIDGRSTFDSPEMIPPPARNIYIYFDFGPSFINELPSGTIALVTVTYWDEGNDSFQLQYDSYNPSGGPFEGAYTATPNHKKTNTRSWKKVVFTLPDARFAGRQNGGCDFRISSNGDGDELIDRIDVSLDPPVRLQHPAVPDVMKGGVAWRGIDFGSPHLGWGMFISSEDSPPSKLVSQRQSVIISDSLHLSVRDDYLPPGIHRDAYITLVYYDNDAKFCLEIDHPDTGWMRTEKVIQGTETGLYLRGIFRINTMLAHPDKQTDIQIRSLQGDTIIDRAFIQVAPGPYTDNIILDHSRDITPETPSLFTYYFYWYDIMSGAHIYDHGDPNDDALQDHPSNMELLSFRKQEWYENELDDVLAAGIDVILPVYWGATMMQKSFSVEGLHVLAKTLLARDERGHPSPRIGLFFDTTTLKNGEEILANSTSTQTNLAKQEGKDYFSKHIRDFYSLIPPHHWATVNGKPLVWLYAAGFSYGHGPDLGPYIRQRFQHQFNGLDIYLVADQSWGDIGQDATSAWGAAFGAKIHDVAAIGPGYNDSAVPGRTTKPQPREEGDFYRDNWEIAIASGKPWVIIETWNEFHEGTDIADSREYGREYIEITRSYADRLKSLPVEEWSLY
jgi:hypothetical protein